MGLCPSCLAEIPGKANEPILGYGTSPCDRCGAVFQGRPRTRLEIIEAERDKWKAVAADLADALMVLPESVRMSGPHYNAEINAGLWDIFRDKRSDALKAYEEESKA